MSILATIPTVDERPTDAQDSPIAVALRKVKPSRRTVIRGLGIAVASGALVPLEWLTGKAAFAAGPKTEHTSCSPANYTEVASNWWSGAKACYGGWRRGVYPCASGWHFEGSRYYSDEGAHSTRAGSTCGSKNAWRWAGGYRCSDANTKVVWNDGSSYSGLTISVCKY